MPKAILIRIGSISVVELKAYAIKAVIKLKGYYRDPEGETAREALKSLGYPVREVKVGKTYFIVVEARDEREVKELAEGMCRDLLANPVKDDWTIEVVGEVDDPS